MSPTQLLQHFDRISEAPDAVLRLRRFILDLAVRGKLVEQDPGDEPASELLKRIALEKTLEKALLVKTGEISRACGATSHEMAGPEFTIPSNWHCARVADVLNELHTGPFGSSLYQSDYQIGGTPVINPALIQKKDVLSL
jgi:type I restriction enzyme, S subunit